ncbi:MAG: hypothetical protein NTZ53_01800 [Cyanobacteria bacterium]|nr:hypothetical protein [Cyanobacteriota bacterium]
MSRAPKRLSLVRPGRRSSVGRQGSVPRRPPGRLRQLAEAFALLAGGVGLLLGLVRLPERLDTLLLVSNAIDNLIAGLSKLGLGLLQLLGVLLVVGAVLLALAFLAGGLIRLARALFRPRARKSKG